jgi:hypothetical protein
MCHRYSRGAVSWARECWAVWCAWQHIEPSRASHATRPFGSSPPSLHTSRATTLATPARAAPPRALAPSRGCSAAPLPLPPWSTARCAPEPVSADSSAFSVTQSALDPCIARSRPLEACAQESHVVQFSRVQHCCTTDGLPCVPLTVYLVCLVTQPWYPSDGAGAAPWPTTRDS